MSAPERIWADNHFWPKVVSSRPGECWIWGGTLMGKGYGSVRPDGQRNHTGAHRVSWAMANGRWPQKGMVIMHSCDTPACVNPDHLFEATQSDNIKDCVGKGRHTPFRPAKKSRCRNGHNFSPENTEYVLSRGLTVRRCKKCKAAAQKKWEAKRKAAK